MIECKSIDGKKVYATCKLTVEEREYLYYHGTSIVEFEEPLCGKKGILTGSPYFRDEYIYSNFSNKNYPNTSNDLNFLTKDKIDFSKYKGVGIKKMINVTAGVVGEEKFVTLVQTKECNDWGGIEFSIESDSYTIRSNFSSRADGTDYADVEEYNGEYYLNYVGVVGEYKSGIESTVDIYIYEIFLVK